jgi:ABC-type multidrug transport system fused ATPase/permease subunit
VGTDLFLAYAHRQLKPPENLNILAKSLLRVYDLNKRIFDESRLFQRISPLVFSAASSDVDAQLSRAGKDEEELAGTQNTSDLISVVLLVLVMTLVLTGSNNSGQLLAGILVLMRLTPMVKKAYVHYTTLRSEALRMRWFEGVYGDIRKENHQIASRTLPVGQVGRVRTVRLRNVNLRIPTPKVPSSCPQLVSVNVSLQAGELVAVVGRSGSSKSSLLRVLTGVYPLSSGQCLINGFDVQQMGEAELRSRVVYLDADSCLFPDELLESMGEPPDRWGRKWTSYLMEKLMSSEGLLVALDQPELWLEQANPLLSYRETLQQLAKRHLLVVATRDESTLELADRMLVMEAAICTESQEFCTNRAQKRISLTSAPNKP